ncbi:MAG: hypothetical protein J6A19_15435 [Oscillospiraceae bacterium]|nr:hypothetical protein [Oscillospiraceae bacterium]
MEFYQLTPAEIGDLIKSAAKRREEQQRTLAVFCWHNAYLTGLAVNSPRHFPRSPEQHFKFLAEEAPDWRKHKAKMAQYAALHNSTFKGGNS